jgi:outer membrane protein OmpA-like peptidoglycan-associated protein
MTGRRRSVRKWTPASSSAGPEPARSDEGTARAIDPAVRQRMETRLGADFSGVRVHTDEAAAAAAGRERAQAFTIGDDVVFGAGRYAPASQPGDALLEHELGHVRDQQASGDVGLQRQPVDEPFRPPSLEREPRQRFRLDPNIGRLSLGLSTLDGFDLNQATLKPAHLPMIADVAGKVLMLLQKMPGSEVTITGHADLVGGEDVNLRIGQRRAEAVRAALIDAGVPEASVSAVSEGESAPVVKKSGPEARNRRVEVRFKGELMVPGAGLTLGTGAARPPVEPTTGFTGKPITPPVGPIGGPPVGGSPWFKPGATLTPPTPSKGYEGPTRAATAGDLGKAVLAIPEVKAQVDAIKEKAGREAGKVWKGASTGEKVALGSFTVSAASLVAVGVLSDPAATSTARDLLDGTEIPLGPKGVKLKLHTKGQVGGSIMIDVLELGR